MKHRRLPQHVLAIVDMLKRLGATVVRAEVQKRVKITWRFAGRVLSALVACGVPKGEDVVRYAARECNRVWTLCGAMPARVS